MLKDFIPIPGFDKYLINEQGEIYSLYVNRLLKVYTNTKSNRLFYRLKDNNGRIKNLFLHRLIAFVFLDLPSIDSDLEVDHIDSNYLNNKLDNLQVLTKIDHYTKTLKDRGHSKRPNCISCSKIINNGGITNKCKGCIDKEKDTIAIEDIEYWVTNYSWVRAGKELGLSDNGVRKRYTKLTGKPPKELK